MRAMVAIEVKANEAPLSASNQRVTSGGRLKTRWWVSMPGFRALSAARARRTLVLGLHDLANQAIIKRLTTSSIQNKASPPGSHFFAMPIVEFICYELKIEVSVVGQLGQVPHKLYWLSGAGKDKSREAARRNDYRIR